MYNYNQILPGFSDDADEDLLRELYGDSYSALRPDSGASWGDRQVSTSFTVLLAPSYTK